MDSRQIRSALLGVWLTLSVILSLILLAPLLLPADALLALVPTCSAKLHTGAPCPLCGTTTAFILISHGDLRGALAANPLSLPLYSLFLLNTLTALGFAARRMLVKRESCKRRLSPPEEAFRITC